MKLVIPTLNEEGGIEGVIRAAREAGLSPLVLDSGSTDGTLKKARELGVPVVNAPPGKSAALRHYGKVYGEERILMIDGDGTYDPREARLLFSDDCAMVIGMRKMGFFSSPVRYVGNRVLNMLFSVLYGRECPDLLSGFRLIDTGKVGELGIQSEGFELETELTAKFFMYGLNVKWVPVKYERRKGNSKFRVFRDTMKIMWCMVRMRLR